MAKTKNYADVIQEELAGNQEAADAVAQEILNAHIAMQLYKLRTDAGLTQAQLAKLVDTSQPVIARLEDADYYGRSLTLLHRIAMALGCTIELNFHKPQVQEQVSYVDNWVFEPIEVQPAKASLATKTVRSQSYDVTPMIAGGQAA
jgi:DNA-binding XRE family transcriptional regulator